MITDIHGAWFYTLMCYILLSHVNILDYVTFPSLCIVYFFSLRMQLPPPHPPPPLPFPFSLLLPLFSLFLCLFHFSFSPCPNSHSDACETNKDNGLKGKLSIQEKFTGSFKIYKPGFYVLCLQIQSVYQALIQALAWWLESLQLTQWYQAWG